MPQKTKGHELLIVGLGPGNPDDISTGAFKALQQAEFVVLRTGVHPAVRALDEAVITYVTCDDIYDSGKDFDDVYGRIVERVMQAALSGLKVAYAVPGHPSVFESTTPLLISRCRETGTPFRIVGSQSFLEPTLSVLGLDPSGGLEITDALRLGWYPLQAHKPLLIAQVYDREVASDVKLLLTETYGDEHPVTVIRAAGVAAEQRVETVKLLELDRIAWIDHLTSVYVPPASAAAVDALAQPARAEIAGEGTCAFPLDPLMDVTAELRGKHGCPWDREQTHMSLRPYVLEEAYEVAEAIELADMHRLCEELGDLLLQIALHSHIAAEQGSFDLNDVVVGITEKMIRRHPHVFSDGTARTSAEVLLHWQQIKQAEKGEAPKSALGDIPGHLPALMRAAKVQHRAAKVGFDWKSAADVFPKVLEEVNELRTAHSNDEANQVEAEVGDLLFAVVNLSRHLGVDPEVALSSAVAKFARRFGYIEERARGAGRDICTMSLEEMDKLWNDAKKAGY